MEQVVCAAGDLLPGEVLATTLGLTPIVVIRTHEGDLHALLDRCVHQGARLSGGRLLLATDGDVPGEYRTVEDRAILKCPWHGYEYDVSTGCAVVDGRLRVRTFAVREDNGHVVVARRAAGSASQTH